MKLRNTSDILPGPPLAHRIDCGTLNLGQYDILGEYYGPHTASSVFLFIARIYFLADDFFFFIEILIQEMQVIFI